LPGSHVALTDRIETEDPVVPADHGHGAGNLLPVDELFHLDRNLIEQGAVRLSCRGAAALAEQNQEHAENPKDKATVIGSMAADRLNTQAGKFGHGEVFLG
jgi:hypothetical protein